MNRIIVAVVLFVLSGIARAGCQIETWQCDYLPENEHLVITGYLIPRECRQGGIDIRVYDGLGEDERLLGTARGFIEKGRFNAVLMNPRGKFTRFCRRSRIHLGEPMMRYQED